MTEENKISESYDQDSIKDVNFVRSMAQQATAIPGAQLNFKYEMISIRKSTKLSEIMRIEDVQLISHCYLIQYIIFGKVLLTCILVIGVALVKFALWLPLLLFEIFGLYGTSRLNKTYNIVFITYLTFSLLLRIVSVIYYLMFIDFSGSYLEEFYYSYENYCGLYGKYIAGTLMIAVYEVLQICLNGILIQKLERIAEDKRIELSYVLISQKVPRFICRDKLRPWKVLK